MLFPELLYVLEEQGIFLCLHIGVGIQNKGCRVTSQLHELSVSPQVGKLQVEGNAALLCTLQIAWAAQFEVGFRYLEAVVGFRHDVQTLACLCREFEVGNKDAVRLLCASSHPAA